MNKAEENTSQGARIALQQARLLYQNGMKPEAEKTLRNLLYREPRNLEAMDVLSVLYLRDNRWEEAIELLQQAVTLAPSSIQFLDNLSAALWSSGKKEAAVGCALRALDLNPNSANANGVLLTMRNEKLAQGQQLLGLLKGRFDRNAATYDAGHKSIVYPTPELLLGEVAALMPGRLGRVLDLGCGTGLGGEAFRESATFLAGVDVSINSIEKAKEKGIYDQLDVSDIFEFLRNTPADSWDVIFASSVFIYFGNLDEILELCHRALITGGILAFDLLEEAKCSGGFSVASPNGMIFEHDSVFVENQAKIAGLTLVQKKELVCNYVTATDNSPGYLFTFKKGASPDGGVDSRGTGGAEPQ